MKKYFKLFNVLVMVMVFLLGKQVFASTTEDISIYPVEDTFVRDGEYANDNYGSENYLTIKDGLTSGWTRRAYFKFDISDKEIDSIEKVYLKVYAKNYDGGIARVNCYEVINNDWNESAVKWSDAPIKGELLDAIFVNENAHYYEIDITKSIINAINRGDNYASITLQGEKATDKAVGINSRESEENRPQLIYREDYNVVFLDDFDGNAGDGMDEDKWKYRGLGPRDDAIMVKDATFKDGNGNLVIETYTKDKKHYTSMIMTKQMWKYGKFEARIQFNTAPGMWSAFWLQSHTVGNPIGNPSQAGVEIDIVEHLRHYNIPFYDVAHKTFINLHWDGYDSDHKKKGVIYDGVDVSQGFHTYTCEWTPDKYRFFVDGNLVWVTNEPISNVEEYIILSNEVRSPGWAGITPLSGYGNHNETWVKMYVDYVKVSQ